MIPKEKMKELLKDCPLAQKAFMERGYEEPDCIWDSLSEEEKSKPQLISCPCRKCSPFSL